MKNQNIFYSIWAIFNDKEEKQLSNLKHKINQKLNGPYFPIHMTICAGFVGEEKKLIKKMQSILYVLNKFYIETDNYGYKNTFFQSFYINVKKNNELLSQKKILDNAFQCPTQLFLPHISLFYGDKSNIIKKEIITNLNNLNKIIKIENLCLAINDEQNLKWKIIKKFQI